MLLTVKQSPPRGLKSLRLYTPPTPPATADFSPRVNIQSHYPVEASILTSAAKPSVAFGMSTPHRGEPAPPLPHAMLKKVGLADRFAPGLPPPAALGLGQSHPPPSAITATPAAGQLPAPPHQWHGSEEPMKYWLQARAEEDRRRQEEEKTRQETLRLEQRKIEQDMLRTSLQGGIPPYMIPMVFAGMGGGSLPGASLEWAQQYLAQAQGAQHVATHPPISSPERFSRRESRAGAHLYHGPPAPADLGAPVSLGAVPPGVQSHPMSPVSRTRRTSLSQGTLVRQPTTPHLPRLNTSEMSIQPPSSVPTMQVLPTSVAPPTSQVHAVQHERQPSPSIHFHHWQPPTSTFGTNNSSGPPVAANSGKTGPCDKTSRN